NPSGGGFFIKKAPPFLPDLRWVTGGFLKMPTCSAPARMRTAAGFQRVKGVTGPPDPLQHQRQRQKPTTSCSPPTSTRTAPQKHSPTYVAISFSYISRGVYWVGCIKVPERDRAEYFRKA